MNEVDFDLFDHCFQCGAKPDHFTAGDSWCWKCDAAAHYGMGLQSVNDETAKVWQPKWLINEITRLRRENQRLACAAGLGRQWGIDCAQLEEEDKLEAQARITQREQHER